jgi:GH25 family lysozyme M1 (1,4-beta-N-acetylmuramidase)
MLEHEISSHLLDDSAIIWVADYNENVTYDIDYTIWQYSKTGESDAVGSKYVDLNYWYTD